MNNFWQISFFRKLKENLLVIIFFLSFIVFFWTKPGEIINGNDTTYPLKPVQYFKQRFFQWNHSIGAGIDFAHGSAGLTWHGLQAIPSFFKLPIDYSQKIFLLIIFNAISFSFYFFISDLLPNNKLAHLTGVIFYCFNPYLFNLWGNIQSANLCAYILIPLLSGFLIRSVKNKIKLLPSAILFSLISVLFSAYASNPQVAVIVVVYFLLFTVFLLIDYIFKNKYLSLLNFCKILFVYLGCYLLFNLFWIIPEVRAVVGNNISLGIPSSESLRGWLDFLSANTNVVNVIRMQGEWMWYQTLKSVAYVSYSKFYQSNFILILLSFLSFFLSFFTILKSKKRFAVFFSLILFLGILFSMGVKPPFGYIYFLLTEKLKLFSFLRSPWYKFSLLTAIAYGCLSAFFVDLFSGTKKIVLVILIIFGQLIYSYPLITGEVFSSETAIPYKYSLPDYIYYSDNFLREDWHEGKVVVLPRQGDLDYYRWGGKSSTQILNLLANPKPVLTEPSWTVLGDTSVNQITKAFYDYFHNAWSKEAVKILFPLNVKYLLHKTDFDYELDNNLGIPSENEKKLAKLSYLKTVSPIGLWSFYEVEAENIAPFVYAANKIDVIDAEPYLLGDYLLMKNTPKSVSVSNDNSQLFDQYNNFSARNFGVGMIKNKINNLQPPVPYVRFYPGNIFYPYVRYKETKTIASMPDSLKKIKSTIFFEGKRIAEIEKLAKNQNKRNNKMIADLLEELYSNITETDSKLSIYEPNNDRTEIEQLQLITGYCQENLSKIKSLKNSTFISKLSAIELETDSLCNTGANLLEKVVSSPEIKKYTVIPPKPGMYRLKILIKDGQAVDSIDNLISGIKINGEAVQFKIAGFNGNTIEIAEIFIPERENLLEILFSKPLTSDPALIFEESIPTNEKLLLPGVEYKKINSTKYIVNVDEATGAFLLVFSENYHPWWKAVISKGEKQEIIPQNKHIKVNGYANGWLIDKSGDYQIVLEYKTQKTYQELLYFTSVLIFIAIFYLIAFKRFDFYAK